MAQVAAFVDTVPSSIPEPRPLSEISQLPTPVQMSGPPTSSPSLNLTPERPVASLLSSLSALASSTLAPLTDAFLASYRSFQEKYPQTSESYIAPLQSSLVSVVDKAGDWTHKYVDTVDEALVAKTKPIVQNFNTSKDRVQAGVREVQKGVRDALDQPQVKHVQSSALQLYQSVLGLVSFVFVYILALVEQKVDHYLPTNDPKQTLYVPDNKAALMDRVTVLITQFILRTYHMANNTAALPSPLNSPLPIPSTSAPITDIAYFTLVYFVVLAAAAAKVATAYVRDQYKVKAE